MICDVCAGQTSSAGLSLIENKQLIFPTLLLASRDSQNFMILVPLISTGQGYTIDITRPVNYTIFGIFESWL